MRTGFWILVGAWLAVAPFADGQVMRGGIVFADYEALFTNYFKTKLANDQLQQMMDAINRERAMLVIRFDQMQEELRDLRRRLLEDELSESAKDNIRRRIDARLGDLRRHEERIDQFNESQARRWEEQNRRIRSNLSSEIQGKIAAYLKNRGFLAVVDRSQVNERGVPVLLYVDPKADITDDLIAEINK
ncbi:MAG TPA: OmpH family outer membrane protein [Kiritimatiellia bacterium]|nr:OmpH family outer membrane protein [Kiritimatiellia bacterium]HMP00178.1 OmpH family outer membrane protein [Kiritimatiellia bacterium]HMP96797.1 OmpH family outer membrane protein [Kiritimatiellia bacterium]